ncbi:DUF7224 domain-containing protein [Cellulomonas bogoriensis]
MTAGSSRALTWSKTASVLAAAGAALAVVGASGVIPVQVPRDPVASPVCSSSEPQVCVWPEHANYLPMLVPLAQRITESSDGILPVPKEFIQEGLSADPGALNTFSWIAPDAGLWHVAEGFASAVLNNQAAETRCWPVEEEDWEQRRVLNTQLSYWLTARAYQGGRPADYHGNFGDTAEAAAVLELDVASQREWVADVLRRIEEIPCVTDGSGE